MKMTYTTFTIGNERYTILPEHKVRRDSDMTIAILYAAPFGKWLTDDIQIEGFMESINYHKIYAYPIHRRLFYPPLVKFLLEYAESDGRNPCHRLKKNKSILFSRDRNITLSHIGKDVIDCEYLSITPETLPDLKVLWVPQNSKIRITSADEVETIEIYNDIEWLKI